MNDRIPLDASKGVKPTPNENPYRPSADESSSFDVEDLAYEKALGLMEVLGVALSALGGLLICAGLVVTKGLGEALGMIGMVSFLVGAGLVVLDIVVFGWRDP